MKTVKLPFAILAISSFSFWAISCKKDTTCKSTIYVIDENGAPVAGATVKISSTSHTSTVTGFQSKILEEKTTTKSGRIDFEQSQPVILELVVEKSGFSMLKPGPISLKFEQGITKFQTVELKQ
jgi:hypothetical protein